MNTEDLRALAERAEAVKGRPGIRLAEVHRRIHTARRRRGAAAAAGSAAVVLALAVGSAFLVESRERGAGPVQHPTPTAPTPTALTSPTAPSPTASTPTETLEIPADQQTITPDIGPGDIPSLAVLATMTNSQPEHRADTHLTATVTTRADVLSVSSYCRSHHVPTWIAYADGDLVGDGPGAGHDWWSFSKCLPEDPTTFEPPDFGMDLTTATESKTVRMVAIAPPPAKLRACLANTPGDYCPLPEPIAATDAEFGFRVYEEKPAPWVLELFKDKGNDEPQRFKALESIKGVAWLIDRAVVAAPDAHRLAFELPVSDSEYLIDVYNKTGPHSDRCMKQHADEIPEWGSTDRLVYEAAVDKLCGVDIRLVVDGTTIAPDGVDPESTGHFAELGAHLSPGTDHRIEVKVIRGDPRNIRYAVVVRALAHMP